MKHRTQLFRRICQCFLCTRFQNTPQTAPFHFRKGKACSQIWHGTVWFQAIKTSRSEKQFLQTLSRHSFTLTPSITPNWSARFPAVSLISDWTQEKHLTKHWWPRHTGLVPQCSWPFVAVLYTGHKLLNWPPHNRANLQNRVMKTYPYAVNTFTLLGSH